MSDVMDFSIHSDCTLCVIYMAPEERRKQKTLTYVQKHLKVHIAG